MNGIVGARSRADRLAAGVRRRLPGLQALLLVLLLAPSVGCASRPASVLDERLRGGQTIAELAAGDRPTVVLVYPPGYCFTCAPQIAQWQQYEREGRIRLAVVLAEEPSEADKRALVMRRIKVSGVLSSPPWRKASEMPREYLVEQGRVRLAAVGVEETGRKSLVFQEVARRPLRSEAMETSLLRRDR